MTDDGWIFSTMTWVDVWIRPILKVGKNLPAIVMSGISGAFAVQLPGFHAKFFFSADKNPALFAVTKYADITFKYKSMKIGIEYLLCVCASFFKVSWIDSPNGGPNKKISPDFNLVACSFNSSTNWKLHPDCWCITYNGMMEITHQYVQCDLLIHLAGGHQQPLSSGHPQTIPNKSRSQNCQSLNMMCFCF